MRPFFTAALLGLALSVPVASALQNPLPFTVCSLEDEQTGQDAVCRNAKFGICVTFWFFAEAPPPCGSVATFDHEGDTYYVSAGPWGLYLESNDCPGLQAVPSDCDNDGDADPADDSRTLGEITGL